MELNLSEGAVKHYLLPGQGPVKSAPLNWPLTEHQIVKEPHSPSVLSGHPPNTHPHLALFHQNFTSALIANTCIQKVQSHCGRLVFKENGVKAMGFCADEPNNLK